MQGFIKNTTQYIWGYLKSINRCIIIILYPDNTTCDQMILYLDLFR